MPTSRLREIREARGFTQAELARRVGVQSTQVSRWERGTATPSARHVRKLARALGVNPDALELAEPT